MLAPQSAFLCLARPGEVLDGPDQLAADPPGQDLVLMHLPQSPQLFLLLAQPLLCGHGRRRTRLLQLVPADGLGVSPLLLLLALVSPLHLFWTLRQHLLPQGAVRQCAVPLGLPEPPGADPLPAERAAGSHGVEVLLEAALAGDVAAGEAGRAQQDVVADGALPPIVADVDDGTAAVVDSVGKDAVAGAIAVADANADADTDTVAPGHVGRGGRDLSVSLS